MISSLLVLVACSTGEQPSSTGMIAQKDVAYSFATSVAEGAFDVSDWSDAEFQDGTAEKLAVLESCKTDTVEKIRDDLWGIAWQCEGISGRPGVLLTFQGTTVVKAYFSMVERQYSQGTVSVGSIDG